MAKEGILSSINKYNSRIKLEKKEGYLNFIKADHTKNASKNERKSLNTLRLDMRYG